MQMKRHLEAYQLFASRELICVLFKQTQILKVLNNWRNILDFF